MGFFFLEIFSNQIISKQDSFISLYKVHFIVFIVICAVISLVIGILSTHYLLPIIISQTIAGLLIIIMNIIAVFVLIVVLLKCYHITKVKGYLYRIRVVVFEFVIICILLTLMILLPQFLYTSPMFYNSYGVRIFLGFTIFFSYLLSSYKIYKIVFIPAMTAIKTSALSESKIKVADKIARTESNVNESQMNPVS